MTIQKFLHSCLLVTVNGRKLLIDPGTFSFIEEKTSPEAIGPVDVILLTHEHPDHYHVDSVKTILKNNPQTKIITNGAVAALLQKENIACSVIEDNQKTTEKGVSIEGHGNVHAVIYPSLPLVQNTGYFIANRLFYPADAFTNPKRPVEILAVPISGPWLRMSEGIDYAKEIKPKICFPVHDGILKIPGLVHRIPPVILESFGIKFTVLEIDKPREF